MNLYSLYQTMAIRLPILINNKNTH